MARSGVDRDELAVRAMRNSHRLSGDQASVWLDDCGATGMGIVVVRPDDRLIRSNAAPFVPLPTMTAATEPLGATAPGSAGHGHVTTLSAAPGSVRRVPVAPSITTLRQWPRSQLRPSQFRGPTATSSAPTGRSAASGRTIAWFDPIMKERGRFPLAAAAWSG